MVHYVVSNICVAQRVPVHNVDVLPTYAVKPVPVTPLPVLLHPVCFLLMAARRAVWSTGWGRASWPLTLSAWDYWGCPCWTSTRTLQRGRGWKQRCGSWNLWRSAVSFSEGYNIFCA